MTYDIDSAVALLRRAPGVLRAMLEDLPPEWLDAPESPDAWSPRDVACHIADLERDGWLPRLRIILDQGAAMPLPAVERERFRVTYERTPIERVLSDFERLRAANLSELGEMRLRQEQLEAVGQHGSLGEVRVSQLLSTWVVHDLTHFAQISRALAAQYRDAVGPWSDFLSILRPKARGPSRRS